MPAGNAIDATEGYGYVGMKKRNEGIVGNTSGSTRWRGEGEGGVVQVPVGMGMLVVGLGSTRPNTHRVRQCHFQIKLDGTK